MDMPEFIITEHAAERMAQRIHVAPQKMQKLCAKAWYGRSVETPKLNARQYKSDHFYTERHEKVARELMGYVFVFGLGDFRPGTLPRQKILITVI